MKWKSWKKRYAFHVAVCVIAIGIAFSINKNINLKRSHIYTVEKLNQTILRNVIEARTEGDMLVFSGWGFDVNYYNENSGCELILQDTETGEALWPKMKKNSEPVQIAERYTDGKDYSGAGFEGSLKIEQLKEDDVYEILLRYTSEYENGDGKKQKYVKTVTTDEFYYQGEMIEYNPKTFQALEISGSKLEKELEGTKLFHYFPEGTWVYYDEKNIYYIIEKENLEWDRNPICPVHWFVKNKNNLPEGKQECDFGNSDFCLKDRLISGLENSKYIVARIETPSQYITYFTTGLYYNDAGWSYQISKQWK